MTPTVRPPRPVTLFRSVRFRIAALNAVAMALATLAALAGVRQAVRWTMLHEVDRTLEEDAAEVALALKELSPSGLDSVADELGRKATGHRQHRWFARLHDAQGGVVWATATAPEAPGPPTTPRRARTVSGYRTLQAAVEGSPLGVARVQVGSSLELLVTDLARINRLAAIALALVTFAAPFCGYALAGLATRDLERMAIRAGELGPAALGERLPLRGVDDEFDRLGESFNALLDRLEAFVEEKRGFLADAAHELRTPIAAIRSTVEVGLGAERSPERYRELLEQVLDESESLELLVNQILIVSEATAAQDRAPTGTASLSDVVERSVEMFRGVAEARGVRIEAAIEPGIAVPGARQHLGQVVTNLLDNAVKYTPDGGVVRATLDTADGAARLTVADTGIGVAAEDLPHLFKRFYRADRARQRDDTRGAGLGLSICQSIVQSLQGTIVCHSAPGEGAEFTVRLPLASTGAAPAA